MTRRGYLLRTVLIWDEDQEEDAVGFFGRPKKVVKTVTRREALFRPVLNLDQNANDVRIQGVGDLSIRRKVDLLDGVTEVRLEPIHQYAVAYTAEQANVYRSHLLAAGFMMGDD